MKRQHLDFKDWKKQLLKNPKVKEEYDRLQPETEVVRAVLQARVKKGITQKVLAEKMNTKQSVISRLESGKGNPSIGFLQKLAESLSMTLEIKFLPR